MATKYGTTTLADISNTGVSSRQKNLSDSASSTRIDRSSHLYMPYYCVRVFKNKGAVLVLFLSFSIFSVFHFLFVDHHGNDIIKKLPAVILIACMLLYPIFGWLADVRYGRYKVIKWSLRITLIALIIFCLVSALPFSQSAAPSYVITKLVLHVPIALGLGGLHANILQFGIYQLSDASSTEIKCFIRWYLWVWYLGGSVIKLSQSCLCSDYEAMGFLLLPTVITLAICVEVIFNHYLVKEPTSANAVVLVFKILHYAIKNKYPRAFTYWDDKPYHRIDLAKTKYGGPYTTEQVEDVKTFFRIVSVIIIASFFTGLYVSMFPVYDKVLYRLRDDDYKEVCEFSYAYARNCFQRTAITYSGGFLMVLSLPLFECCPCLIRYPVSILKKTNIGFVFFFLSFAACAAIEFAAQHETDQHVNVTSCPLLKEGDPEPNSLSLDYKWMMIPYLLNQLAQFIFLASATEFVCAQSPYSMKGLLFGFAYGSIGFFAIVGYSLMLPVQLLAEKKLSHGYGCVFWYLILSLGILIAILLVLFFIFKSYKNRSRVDNER